MREAPLQYLAHAAGPASIPTERLAWALIALVSAVVLIVAGLLCVAIAKRRTPPSNDERLPPEGGGMRWIYIGTGVSTVALFGALIYAMVTLDSVASPSQAPALTLDVTGYDWWWRIEYPQAQGGTGTFATANELHIPTGVPVRLRLHSADVIHTFWVPLLAGKTEMIPGQVNEQWIEADRPGVFRGQCSQFCGAQHAHMAFEVVAQSPAEFDAWQRQQARAAAPPASPDAAAGRHLFESRCAGCHTVRGTAADGMQAPDLTHLASRRTIAAATLANTPENLIDWIAHAQQIKPDAMMPSMPMTASDAHALSAYLATLQ